jgi:phosphoribosylformylglycinamidine synthase
MNYNIYAEKKEGFRNEAESLKVEIREMLGIMAEVRIVNVYTVFGLKAQNLPEVTSRIFSEPSIDTVYSDERFLTGKRFFILELIPGQFDQRAKASEECIQLLIQDFNVRVGFKRIYLFEGIGDDQLEEIKDYVCNPVEMREGSLLIEEVPEVRKNENVEILEGFRKLPTEALRIILDDLSLAMSLDDLSLIQAYFRTEDRDPTMTEIRVIDTYWSDHCRHTTFNTVIRKVDFLKNAEKEKAAFDRYLALRKTLGREDRDITLMDIATIGARYLRQQGLVPDLDVSEEINACSIARTVPTNAGRKDVLIMFKNETHNHPTEIEPFGGAATCLGGAIRDPLSGRSYVYQGMRITGCGDPRTPLAATLSGKLPQRVITRGAAKGFSSYGNQIGLNTGFVEEIYHDGYVAKRMEVGAVIGSTLRENVVRKTPKEGDVVILLGGRTGRDGIGGATGSSKVHSETSLKESGSEVQKGNPVEERKIQRLFRNEEAARLIVRCNDFGAGGVSVAIGELAEALDIHLDRVPKKYQGLDPTEIAISESQERMAVVVDLKDADRFIHLAEEENLEATVAAEVTGSGRLRMFYEGNTVVDLARTFLDTNGAKSYIEITVDKEDAVKMPEAPVTEEDILREISDLNFASQRGLVENFDSTIGRNQVVLPYGGRYQDTRSQGMVSLIPVKDLYTTEASIMTYGFDPYESSLDTYTGAYRSVVESIAKVVSLGGSYGDVRLSFQEYFERLGRDSRKWGKPLSSLLGALSAQLDFRVPAIGGKDSMSGTFREIDVPPTLISFAVNTEDSRNIMTNDLKAEDSILAVLRTKTKDGIPSFESFQENADLLLHLRDSGLLLSCDTLKRGVVKTLVNMAMGSRVGFVLDGQLQGCFGKDPGSFLLQLDRRAMVLPGSGLLECVGTAGNSDDIRIGEVTLTFETLLSGTGDPLRKVFSLGRQEGERLETVLSTRKAPGIRTFQAKPKVLIPVFPGSNCEYDLEYAFREAGGNVDTFVFRNREQDLMDSIRELSRLVSKTNILMIPGGFSAGDEPEGSGKYIANILRNPEVKEAVMDLLKNRDGLILGICNGFQGLVKSGLLPYGEIIEPDAAMPNLTYNTTGKHMSLMARTMVVSRNTPWMDRMELGKVYDVPISHGEGRFVADDRTLQELLASGQVITQYADLEGRVTMEAPYNPNGSMLAIEGISSQDGRVFGKMGHTERYRSGLYRNYPGTYMEDMFRSGIEYFR